MTTTQQPGTNNANRDGSFASQAHPTAGLNGETTYYAQPYSMDATGFYFNSMEDYTAKMDALTDRFGCKVEEVELQFIDGSTGDAQLFNALKIDQSTLERWFDDVEDLSDNEKAALFFLVDNNGMDLDDAMDKRDEVMLREGSELDAGTEIFDELYLDNIPAGAKTYIDYESFARDLRMNGEIVEVEFDGTTYTCVNASSL